MSPHYGHSNYSKKPTPRHTSSQGKQAPTSADATGEYHIQHNKVTPNSNPTQSVPAAVSANANAKYNSGRIYYSGQIKGIKNLKKSKAIRQKLVGASTAAYASKDYTWIGNLFYNLGFYAEYFTLRVLRILRDGLIFGGQIFLWLFGGVGQMLASLAKEIVAPFKVAKPSAKQAQGDATGRAPPNKKEAKAGSAGAVVLGVLRVLLPVAATVVLVFTINSIFTKNYALEVQVNGAVIGYVADETVLEDAQNILRMKIQLAPNQNLAEWQFTPVLAIGTSDSLSNKNEIADKILLNSSDDIIQANGIYIDGQLIGVTTEGEEMRHLLDGMLDKYADPSNPEAKVAFVRDVQVSEDGGLYFTESLEDFDDLREKLASNVTEEITYTVTEKITLGEIAHEGGISFEDLIARNPQFEGKKDTFRPEIGTVLLLHRAQPYLQVQVSYRRSEQEPVPFEVLEVLDDTLRAGTKRRRVEGEEGLQNVWYDYVYVDGEQVQRLPVEGMTELLVAPVDEVWAVGTLVLNTDIGGIGGYSGSYMFPVPDSTRSSRGFIGGGIHNGVDINAPMGTPVYASNAGTVVQAGWAGSYGLLVEIQHDDGLITRYAHNSALYVQVGDRVGQMAHIAAIGSTGNSTGPHCHFEILVNGVRVDPYGFVPNPYPRFT